MKRIEGLDGDATRALEILRALANPARLRIVAELAARDACVAGEIIEVLPLAQSTVSEHLKVLKEAGIVRGAIDSDVCYCLEPATLNWFAAYCTQLAETCCPPDPSAVAAPAAGAAEV